MQAYEGYFENGQFYMRDKTHINIKGRKRAFITILDEPVQTYGEQILDIIKQKNIPHKTFDVNAEGHIIVDKDKDPELYDWAVNG